MFDAALATAIALLAIGLLVCVFRLSLRFHRWYKNEQMIAASSFAASKRDMRRMKLKQPVGYKPKNYKPMEFRVRDPAFLESCTAHQVMNTPVQKIRD